MYIVYKIVDRQTSRPVYIGKTCRVSERKYEHTKRYPSHRYIFKVIVKCLTSFEASLLELLYINKYSGSINNCIENHNPRRRSRKNTTKYTEPIGKKTKREKFPNKICLQGILTY
jgi:hypothetical protein